MEYPNSRDELLKVLTERTPMSGKMWQDAQEYVPGGLLSVARKFKPYPFYTYRGEGPYIWDVDENRYIDCCISYGTLILGHRPAVVTEAIRAQEERGVVYGTPHPLEIAYAERFIECVPCAERMLLCNSGTEATMQGIRIMRAYTSRKKIGKFEGGYHGWHDYAMWSTNIYPDKMGPDERPNAIADSAGIPEEIKETILLLPLNEAAFDLIEENASDLAGVMIEPIIGTGAIPVGREYLLKLREVTERHGILLMFDEVKTGFRLALGGGQEYYGVIPDLATYAKAIGGGMPIGAVGCSKEIMEAVTQYDFSISVAGTFSGNPMSLAAGYAVLGHLMQNPQIYDELERKGKRLRDGFNEYMQSKGLPASMTGEGSFFQSHMKPLPIEKPRDMIGQHSDALYDMQLFLRLNGVHVAWFHDAFISTAHSDQDIEDVLRAHKDSAEAALRLHGVI
ncbi:MAG: aspartate aminotransferase family protein [Anaerolineales bacterium]|nr:MAG: aspartate aminotransferase family protein [Anaerolineales bacterium]